MGKKNKFGLIASIGIFLFYFYYNSRQTLINSVSIVPTGLGFGGSIVTPVITIQLNAINPSSGTATVKYVTANINYQNTTIGTINLQKPFTILPKLNTSFEVPLIISDLGTVVTLFQILQNGSPVQFDIVGQAQIDSFTLPLNLTYKPV
jgi:hypothetical protein